MDHEILSAVDLTPAPEGSGGDVTIKASPGTEAGHAPIYGNMKCVTGMAGPGAHAGDLVFWDDAGREVTRIKPDGEVLFAPGIDVLTAARQFWGTIAMLRTQPFDVKYESVPPPTGTHCLLVPALEGSSAGVVTGDIIFEFGSSDTVRAREAFRITADGAFVLGPGPWGASAQALWTAIGEIWTSVKQAASCPT